VEVYTTKFIELLAVRDEPAYYGSSKSRDVF